MKGFNITVRSIQSDKLVTVNSFGAVILKYESYYLTHTHRDLRQNEDLLIKYVQY